MRRKGALRTSELTVRQNDRRNPDRDYSSFCPSSFCWLQIEEETCGRAIRRGRETRAERALAAGAYSISIVSDVSEMTGQRPSFNAFARTVTSCSFFRAASAETWIS